jgi:hypothetical protein
MEPRPEDDYEGFAHDKWPTLPTEADVRQRMAKLAAQIEEITGGQVRVYLAFAYVSQKGNWSPTPPDQEENPEWSYKWRKPQPGMLLQAARDFGVNTPECIFVGDQDSDREAAESAGMAYRDSDELMAVDVTISYPKGWVVEWLRPYQRIGLKVEESFARFEAVVAEQAKWWRVGQVTFERLEGDGDEFAVSPPEHVSVVAGESLARMISDLFINREWLVYESAEEHVEALYGTRWQVTSAVMLEKVYGITIKEAQRLMNG